ncbi:MAG: type II secretion system protein L [Polaribacter sp.]|jgi:type II secretion system protein L|tara:strand:- start:2332 stop:3465 length:1134 start_codon:yes stop_codon:yes gene_type:complete
MSVEHLYNLDQQVNTSDDPLQSVAGTNLESKSLWVPSERIGLHSIDIPSAPERKWAELIPWILEDRVLQPVEEMHFVVAARDDQQVHILAVSQQDIREWIRIADNAGIAAVAMAPDFMALDWEPGILSVGWREGMLLVRDGINSGFAALPAVGWVMVDSILKSTSVMPRLSISLPDEDMVPEHLRAEANINSSSVDWQFSAFPAVNLMTAEFKPKAARPVWFQWWPVAASTIAVLLLTVIYLQLASRSFEAEVSDLQQHLLTSHSRVFGGAKPALAEFRSSAEARIEQLFKQQKSLQAEPVAALSALDAVMNACQCELQAMTASKSGVQLKVLSGSKLLNKSLNVPGYQISLEQDQKAGPDVFALSMKPRVGQERNL